MVKLTNRAASAGALDPESAALTGLDNLDLPITSRHSWSARRIWAATWPKLLAIGLVIGVWEIVHLTGWKKYVLPGPGTVFANLWEQMQHAQLWQAIYITMHRAVIGFALSVLIGAVISEPMAARSGLIRDTRTPITAPMSTDSANPITARCIVM